MGTQLSDEHITFIRKLTSNITLMFDGDFAGSEATLKTGQNLLQQELMYLLYNCHLAWIRMNTLVSMATTHLLLCKK